MCKYCVNTAQGGHVYSRLGNPTCDDAEATISSLEGAAGSVLFGSGSAAIGITLLTFLKAGDHVVRLSRYTIYRPNFIYQNIVVGKNIYFIRYRLGTIESISRYVYQQ